MNTYLNNLYDLENKVVGITGAGGHLCSSMALGFASAGCKVALLDIRLSKVETLKKELNNKGFNDIIAIEIDVSNRESHELAKEKILKEFNSIDIFINGAGINDSTPFLDITIEQWQEVLSSQLTGTFLGCQVFGKYMVQKGSGSIINISSASAGPPLSKAFAYSVAKAGILNLTQNLGREWGTSGVRVNAIRPGFLPTEWNKKNFITKDRELAILSHTPMNRFGEPNELIGAMLWLGSSASGFVTGSEVAVDGGFSCMTI